MASKAQIKYCICVTSLILSIVFPRLYCLVCSPGLFSPQQYPGSSKQGGTHGRSRDHMFTFVVLLCCNIYYCHYTYLFFYTDWLPELHASESVVRCLVTLGYFSVWEIFSLRSADCVLTLVVKFQLPNWSHLVWWRRINFSNRFRPHYHTSKVIDEYYISYLSQKYINVSITVYDVSWLSNVCSRA